MTVINLASEKDVINRSGSARHLQCYNCSKKHMEDFVQNCIKTPSSNSLNIHGISYHLKDFVYVKTRSDPLLRIGQITDLQLSSGNSKLKILFLERIKVDDESMTPKSMVSRITLVVPYIWYDLLHPENSLFHRHQQRSGRRKSGWKMLRNERQRHTKFGRVVRGD